MSCHRRSNLLSYRGYGCSLLQGLSAIRKIAPIMTQKAAFSQLPLSNVSSKATPKNKKNIVMPLRNINVFTSTPFRFNPPLFLVRPIWPNGRCRLIAARALRAVKLQLRHCESLYAGFAHRGCPSRPSGLAWRRKGSPSPSATRGQSKFRYATFVTRCCFSS